MLLFHSHSVTTISEVAISLKASMLGVLDSITIQKQSLGQVGEKLFWVTRNTDCCHNVNFLDRLVRFGQ